MATGRGHNATIAAHLYHLASCVAAVGNHANAAHFLNADPLLCTVVGDVFHLLLLRM